MDTETLKKTAVGITRAIEDSSIRIDVPGGSDGWSELIGSVNALIDKLAKTEKELAAEWEANQKLQNEALWQVEELKARNEEFEQYAELLTKQKLDIEEQSQELLVANRRLEQEVADRKQAETELERYHNRLQELVNERTDALHAINEELEQKIIEQKDAEAAIRAEKEFSDNIIETANALIVTLDNKGKIVTFNRHLESITGYTKSEVIGKSWYSLFVLPEDRKQQKTMHKKVLMQAPGVMKFEGFIQTKQGQKRLINWNKNVVKDSDDVIRGSLSIGIDVTEQRRIEGEIRRLNEELEDRVQERTLQLDRTNRQIESFSYSVSHDLRTPLRAIDGFCQILIDEYDKVLDETGISYLQRVRKASQRMGLLIDDLNKFSRLSRHQMRTERVNLSSLADVIIDDLQRLDPKRKATPKVSKNLSVQGDPYLLKMLLRELIGNAWKFTQKRKTARIEFNYRMWDGIPAFYVHDNGVGFSMKYADKLFRLFEQLHDPEVFHGTGTGLATAKQIVDLHGGDIWAEARAGKGATFYFTLQPPQD